MRDDDSAPEATPTRRRLCSALAAGTMGLSGCIKLTTSDSGTQSGDGGSTGTAASGANDVSGSGGSGTDRAGADDASGSGGDDTGDASGEPITYDFEAESALTGWTIGENADGGELGRTDRFAHTGAFSVGITGAPTDVIASVQPFGGPSAGRQVTRLRYAWLELSDSFGGGIQLLNSNGDTELFTGTDNPEWIAVSDADPERISVVYEGDGYERWIRTTVTFDWAAAVATVRFRDTESGATRERTVELGAGADIATVRIVPFTSLRYGNGEGFRNDSCYMFWDSLELEL